MAQRPIPKIITFRPSKDDAKAIRWLRSNLGVQSLTSLLQMSLRAFVAQQQASSNSLLPPTVHPQTSPAYHSGGKLVSAYVQDATGELAEVSPREACAIQPHEIGDALDRLYEPADDTPEEPAK